MGENTKLTPKQERFIQEYLIDFNATQAATRAGYSERTANEQGARLLTKANIQEALQIARQELAAKLQITAEKVLKHFADIAFADIAECYDDQGNLKNIHEIPKEIRAALAGLDVFEEFEGRGEDKKPIGFTKKIKLWDKIKALESLGRNLGLFNADRPQEGRFSGDIVFRVVYEDREKAKEE